MSEFVVALCQMHVAADKERNLAKAVDMIRSAKSGGADIAVLPEMFLCPYVSRLFSDYAEEIPNGPAFGALSNAARENRIFLFAGSMPEVNDGHIYNTAAIINEEGALVGIHRKMHLFDIDAPGELVFRESESLTAGSSATVVETPYIRAGVGICYDMRFPELSRIMAMRGAGMIVMPAAFNMVTGPAHWEMLIRMRATDNQVYVCACAPARDPDGPYVSYANSMVADPWGQVAARAGENEEIVFAKIDTKRIDDIRKKLPLLKHLRRDLYGVSWHGE